MQRIREVQEGSLAIPQSKDQESVVVRESQEFTEVEITSEEVWW